MFDGSITFLRGGMNMSGNVYAGLPLNTSITVKTLNSLRYSTV